MISEFSKLQQTNLEKFYQQKCCLSKRRAKQIAGWLNMAVENVTMWFVSRNADEKTKPMPKHSCSFCKGNLQFLSHSEVVGTKICKTIHISEEYNHTCCVWAFFVKINTCMQNANACHPNTHSQLISACTHQIYLKLKFMFLWPDDKELCVAILIKSSWWTNDEYIYSFVKCNIKRGDLSKLPETKRH